MAYTTPPTHAHGDEALAAQLQIFCDDLDYLYTLLKGVNFPSAHAVPGLDNDRHYFIHRHRWLWFQSDGALVDPENEVDNVETLTEDTEPTLFDLSTVDWLYVGKKYYVDTCTWAQETPDP